MVESFNTRTARELADKVIEFLKPLGVEENVSFTFNGGQIHGSQVKMNLIIQRRDESGAVAADKFTDTSMRLAFSNAGVSVTGDVVGSIWRDADGLLQVTNYHPKRPKYSVEFRRVDGTTRLAAPRFFLTRAQVVQPDLEDFYFWLRVDPELLSDKDTERFDAVNDWLTLYVPEVQQDKFFDAINSVIAGKVTRKIAEKILGFFAAHNNWDSIIKDIKALAK